MKTILAAVVLLGTAALSFGQTRPAATGVIPSVTFEILEQTDSPLTVSVDKRLVSGMPGAPLKITNNGASAVNAYVLYVKAGKLQQTYMTFLGKGIPIGESHTQGVSVPPVPGGTDHPVVSVDYVQFDDGRSWGDDALGKSKNVQAFLAGRALAISRLKDLLAGQDDTDFMKSIDTFRSSSFGEPVLPAGRPPRNIDYTAKGYDEILNVLRRMPKRADEAKELARKLELMQLQ